jgi:hypothetical protein
VHAVLVTSLEMSRRRREMDLEEVVLRDLDASEVRDDETAENCEERRRKGSEAERANCVRFRIMKLDAMSTMPTPSHSHP